MQPNDLTKEFLELLNKDETPKSRVVVRLVTSYWHDKNGMNVKKTLRFLKRKTEGNNFLLEDADMTGCQETMDRIVNLNECKDGLYDVITVNEWGAWETPHIIEDYDFKLIPLK